jgi:hypothetical protein
MLTIYGPTDRASRLCDGLSRRSFLRVGGLGMAGLGAAGLSLADVLRADAASGNRASRKSLIMIYLVGGPPHQDLFDLKPNAPLEYRGEFSPIRTSVPGIEICEHLPGIAANMQNWAVVRSIVDAQAGHDAYQCFTGRRPRGPQPSGGWPAFGSTVTRLRGPINPEVPPYVSLCYTCTHGPYNEPGPGFTGVGQAPFRPLAEGKADLVLNGITLDRLGDRRGLLSALDGFHRAADNSGMMAGFDDFTQQALGVRTGSQLAAALDLSQEDPKIVARYGTGNPAIKMDGNGAPRVPQSMLMARRLIEAGARVVTLNYSKWDWHGGRNNSTFKRSREDFPAFDRAMSALMQDLHERGLAKDTTVLAWGEFGRTPLVNSQCGRDHWPRVSCALLGGGGMKTGQVIGATDRLAGEAVERPVKFGEVFATLYRNLGIDTAMATLPDGSGRPQYLVENNERPIQELV